MTRSSLPMGPGNPKYGSDTANSIQSAASMPRKPMKRASSSSDGTGPAGKVTPYGRQAETRARARTAARRGTVKPEK